MSRSNLIRSNLNRSDDEVGWFGTGMKPIEPWTDKSYRDYWAGKGVSVTPYDEDAQKRYKLYTMKTLCTPGTAIGTELFSKSSVSRYEPYLLRYTPEWARTEDDENKEVTTTPFEDSMFQMALSSTKFQLNILERWQKWCSRWDKPRTRESFLKFAEILPCDMDLSRQMLERMNFFSNSFSNIFNAAPCFDLLMDDGIGTITCGDNLEDEIMADLLDTSNETSDNENKNASSISFV